MSLVLHYHPLSSFCHKVLIALYENETPFTTHHLDLSDPAVRAEFNALWPIGKMPVLVDSARSVTIPESSVIIEYLDRHYPGKFPLHPQGDDVALEVGLWDRVIDCYLHQSMFKIVSDVFRPEDAKDPYGVGEAEVMIGKTYALLNDRMKDREFVAGDTFSLADCAAVPALFYSGCLVSFADDYPDVSSYFERLIKRPVVARVLEEAKPWFHFFPYADRIPKRFR